MKSGTATAAPPAGTPSSKTDSTSDKADKPLFVPDPEKARRFFTHAKGVHETTQYEYAMQSWLSGLRFDPTSQEGLVGFFTSAGKFMSEAGKKGPSKETMKAVDGRTEVDRFLSLILDWAIKPNDSISAVRATEQAAKLGLVGTTVWLGERAMAAAGREKKPRRDSFVKLFEIFGKVGAFELAVRCGEFAQKIGPIDGALDGQIKNMSAQATMSRGGYEKTAGQAGGYRQNIRDIAKQEALARGDQVVKTEETLDAEVTRSEADWKTRPDDVPALMAFCRSLTQRGAPGDEERAIELLTLGYERTRQFKLRQTAGDIRMRITRRQLAELERSAKSAPGDAAARQAYEEFRVKSAHADIEEYLVRVEAYPTDLGLKFELGRRYFELADWDKAIPLFQESQLDAKHRLGSLSYLGQAFMKIGWVDAAIQAFRQALASHGEQNDEFGLSLRYGLLVALESHAGAERDTAAAEEADRIAASIALQQFNYRDIRARRESIKKLIVDLRKPSAQA